MALKHLLVHVDSSAQREARLALAVWLATKHGAQLNGLFAENEQLGPSIVSRRNPANVARARESARAAFEGAAAAAGIAREWWQIEAGDYATVINWTVACCRHVDLAIFGQHDGGEDRVPDDLLKQVLLHSGRPMLVVPRTGQHREVGRRVLIVWTGSGEAARAVNDALPLLQAAEEVTLLSLQQASVGRSAGPVPRVDIAAHLRTHGVSAKYERHVLDEIGVVDTVLTYASEWNADLTVIGGYAPGFADLQRSSTVRDLLRAMTTPVLLSH